MFHYADGERSVGPVPLEALRGRISPQTLVWREGMTDWQPAADVAELRSLFEFYTPQGVVDAADPSLPRVVSYAPLSASASTPGLATASLVLGLVCLPLLCVWPFSLTCAVLAVVFGFIARGQCVREQRPGGGMALAGIILGFVPLLIVIAFVLFFVVAMVLAAAGA